MLLVPLSLPPEVGVLAPSARIRSTLPTVLVCRGAGCKEVFWDWIAVDL